MKVAIVGVNLGDVTEFVNGVVFPALLRDEHKDYDFEIQESNGQGKLMVTARRRGPGPKVHIRTFNSPAAASMWLMSELP